jgi:hypothetical protein
VNLVAELDALQTAVDLERASRAVVQAVLQGAQGEGDAGSAALVHEQTVAMVLARARALVAKADA